MFTRAARERGSGPLPSIGGMSTARGLLMACHPLPTVAVTGIAGCLAFSVGLPVGAAVVLIATILTGQLSIGWSNDVIDADRDRGRTDKPLAVGSLDRTATIVATAAALAATIGLSVLLGAPAGVAALVIVVCGWAYNLGLRSTALSFLPYAVAFGVLPATATLALADRPLPAWWAMAAGAMLGVAAHLLNVLPDLRQDAANGIRGLPHRCGASISANVAMLLVLGVAVVLLLGPPGHAPAWRWIAFGLLVALAGVSSLRRGRGDRMLFSALVVGAAVDVLLFAFSGTSLLTVA